MKKCAICGDILQPPNKKFCNRVYNKKCSYCNSEMIYKCTNRSSIYCSNECTTKGRAANIKSTMVERYGVEYSIQSPEIMKKKEKTMLERYGVKQPFSSKRIYKKGRDTMQEKYGVKYGTQSDELLQKRKENNIEKYGTDEVLKVEEIRSKISSSLKENYGVDNPMKSPIIKKRQVKTVQERYNVNYTLELEKAKQNNKGKRGSQISSINRQWAKKLSQAGYKVIYEHRIENYYYDLYLSDLNILIEINPTATHNVTKSLACIMQGCDENCDRHTTIDIDYHKDKTSLALNNGFHLINVYEWNSFKEVIEIIQSSDSSNLQKIPLGLKNYYDVDINKYKYKPESVEVKYRDSILTIHTEGYYERRVD